MEQINSQHVHQTNENHEGNTTEQVAEDADNYHRNSSPRNQHNFHNYSNAQYFSLSATPPVLNPFEPPQNNAYSMNTDESSKTKNTENLSSLASCSYQPNFMHASGQASGDNQVIENHDRISQRNNSIISHNPQSPYLFHHLHHHLYYLPQTIPMGCLIHSTINAWIPLHITENNINPVAYIHGRRRHSYALELTNVRVPASSEASSNAIIPFCPPSLANRHQHPLHVQNMQLQSYSYPNQMQGPFYPYALSYVLPVHLNFTASRFPLLPPNAEHIFRPIHTLHAVPNSARGTVFISPEGVVFMDRFYGGWNTVDQHQDMRYDTDGMTYEQLLDLGEQIGVVNTGLTEEYITNHLKTNVLTCASQANGVCSICQEGYETDKVTGTLDCGHDYHKVCIKDWLLMKNICPICKNTALDAHKKE